MVLAMCLAAPWISLDSLGKGVSCRWILDNSCSFLTSSLVAVVVQVPHPVPSKDACFSPPKFWSVQLDAVCLFAGCLSFQDPRAATKGCYNWSQEMNGWAKCATNIENHQEHVFDFCSASSHWSRKSMPLEAFTSKECGIIACLERSLWQPGSAQIWKCESFESKCCKSRTWQRRNLDFKQFMFNDFMDFWWFLLKVTSLTWKIWKSVRV